MRQAAASIIVGCVSVVSNNYEWIKSGNMGTERTIGLIVGAATASIFVYAIISLVRLYMKRA